MKTLIIAEAGVNHNGSFEKALELIDVAKYAGVDFVKFQTFKTELNISQNAEKALYQKKNTGVEETQYEMVKKLEFSYEQFIELKDYCRKKGVGFLSTAFDLPSIDFLSTIQDIFKIPSGEIVNYPYLSKIASLGKPVILSTGMSTMDEIEQALEVLTEEGLAKDLVSVLHCNTQYPTPMSDVNLTAMNSIAEELKVKVGYSDHTLGIEVPVAAVALGASVIEKHFTLSRDMEGPDHKASLEPHELKSMVECIRNIEKAISGDGEKKPSESEKENIHIARKSIHTSRKVNKGEVIRDDMLIPLRPGDGLSPMKWKDVIGSTLSRDLEKFEKIHPTDLDTFL